jgi:hypothetical protein
MRDDREMLCLVVLPDDDVSPSVLDVRSAIHFAGSRCPCGRRHHRDEASLLIVLGPTSSRDDRGAQGHGRCTVWIVEERDAAIARRSPLVIVPRASAGKHGASIAIRNLTDGLIMSGLIGYSFEDLRAIIGAGASFDLLAADSETLLEAAEAVARGLERIAGGSVHLGMVAPLATSLGEISRAASLIADALRAEDDLIFYAVLDEPAQRPAHVSALVRRRSPNHRRARDPATRGACCHREAAGRPGGNEGEDLRDELRRGPAGARVLALCLAHHQR